MSAPQRPHNPPKPCPVDRALSALRDLHGPYLPVDEVALSVGLGLHWEDRIALDRLLDITKDEQRRLYLHGLARHLEENPDGTD